MNVTAFVVPLFVASTLPLSAQTRPPVEPRPSVRLPQLFATPPLPGSAQSDSRRPQLPVVPPAASPSAKPRMVCGLTLLEADPTVDPRIQLPKLQTDGTFSIRAMQPPICGASDR